MNHTDSSLHRDLSPGWQVLGELELTVDPDTDHTVDKWLATIISPLDLHADLLNKVLRSAQEAVARAMQAEAVMKLQHTHLVVFIPTDRPTIGGTWGFFRIEKVGIGSDNHSIEFYLYLE